MIQAARRRRLRRKQHVILLVLLILAGLGGFWMVERTAQADRIGKEAAALRVSEAAAQAVRQRIERSLEAITSLHAKARRVRIERLAQPSAEPSSLERHLLELTHAGRFGVLQVAIIDAAGSLVWSTVPGFIPQVTPVDLSDREHFRVHRDGRREPFISAPLVGRASGRWSVQVTQALLSEEDQFLGVAVVSIDPLGLGADLADLDFAPGAVATLLRDDGIVLTRSGEAATFMGKKISDRWLQQFNAQPQGTASLVSSLDGRALLVAWQRVPDWPLLLTFGLDQRPLRVAAEEFRSLLLMALLAGLAGAGAAGLLIINWFERGAERADAARAELSVREVTDLLEAMPGAAYRGTISAAGDYRSLYLGSAIVKMIGWPLQDHAAPGFYRSLIAGAGAREVGSEFLRRAFAASEAIAEYRLRSAQGHWVWVRDHCRVVRSAGEDGRAEVVGLIIDITAERKLKAQAVAAAKLATLGEMATGLAHELNQPCASITLAADAAAFEMDRAGAGDLASARGRLDDIALQTMRMRQVIDHFQIFGRSSEGEDGAVSVSDAVAGALKISTGMLKAAGVALRVDLPANLPQVRGQLVPLEQVLVNLLLNARDAMCKVAAPARQVEIAAWVEREAARVVLTVRDHGHGVAPEHMDRLFEPFFTTKPLGEGTGLGLAIAYGTLRGFGGSIDVQNHADAGAVVTIQLELADPVMGNFAEAAWIDTQSRRESVPASVPKPGPGPAASAA